MGLAERTIGGLHDHLMTAVIGPRFPDGGRGRRAADLGAGSGALAARLAAAGFDVTAVDREVGPAPVRWVAADLDDDDVVGALGEGRWALVCAVEVIEHLERPVGLLRTVARLLAPDGLGVVTTPNVDNLPARVKLLVRGRLRMMDVAGDPTHISPVFAELLHRTWLPRAGLVAVDHTTYPPDGYLVARPWTARLFAAVARVWPGEHLLGDNHVVVVRRADGSR